MEFIFLALGIALAAGIAWGVVSVATRQRTRSPTRRGAGERRIILGAAILGGPSAVLLMVLIGHGTVGGEFLVDLLIVGPVMAMPASALICWITGELLSGPTRRSWVPLIATIIAAEVGFGLAGLGTEAAWAVTRLVREPDDQMWIVFRATGTGCAFLAGGAASWWAYLRLRREPALVAG